MVGTTGRGCLVGIGSSERDRAEVTSLCRATGL
jgi:hypothetical protein